MTHSDEYYKTPLGDPEELTQFKLDVCDALLRKIGQQIHDDSCGFFGRAVATDIIDVALGLAGESGEFVEIIKKIRRGTLSRIDPDVVAHLCEEMVDVFIYLMKGCHIINFDIVKGYMEKREYNIRRFSDASSTDQSNLDAEVRGRQRGTIGPSAFVSESDLQKSVQPEEEARGVSDS